MAKLTVREVRFYHWTAPVAVAAAIFLTLGGVLWVATLNVRQSAHRSNDM